MMFTGILYSRASSANLWLHCLTLEPSKITLPCKEGTDLIINRAEYGSNWTSFAIWTRAMFFGVLTTAVSCITIPATSGFSIALQSSTMEYHYNKLKKSARAVILFYFHWM